MNRLARHEWALAVGVAVLVGYVDAVGFLKSGGLFVSFMSGNTTQLGVNAAESSSRAWFAASLIGIFVVGVVIGSLVGRITGVHRRPIVLGLVAILLAIAASLRATSQTEFAVVLMALAMGAINAVFEKSGDKNGGSLESTAPLLSPRWTHGLLLQEYWSSWGRNVVLWTSICGGAVIGAAAYLHFSITGIWIASCASSSFALIALIVPSRRVG